MPTDHTKQWLHNRAFISTIDPEFPDWAVTATFYTALHAVDSLFEHDRVGGIVSHEVRNEVLARTSRYAKIWQNYQPLYGLARTVRYFADPTKWVTWDKIEGEVFRRYLYPLERSVRKLVGKDGDLPPVAINPPPGPRPPSKPDPSPFPS